MTAVPGVPVEAAVVVSVPSEDAMFELLSGLNVSGIHPELPSMRVTESGGVAPFLATLTDPDADHVNYITSDERGLSRCIVGCDNCGSMDQSDDWTPEYPVSVLVGEWPDVDRCRVDEIEVWWVASRDAATLPSLREVIAAEVLAPVRGVVGEVERYYTDGADHVPDEYGVPTLWLLDRLRAALCAPVQAAEPRCEHGTPLSDLCSWVEKHAPGVMGNA